MSPQDMILHWYAWLDDNPDADQHQRYYAMGVIDGLRYAVDPAEFTAGWLDPQSMRDWVEHVRRIAGLKK